MRYLLSLCTDNSNYIFKANPWVAPPPTIINKDFCGNSTIPMSFYYDSQVYRNDMVSFTRNQFSY